MKLLLGGDQHITSKKPKNRTDDYFQTVQDKFGQELRIATGNNCSYVILPGDVFDTFKEPHIVVQQIMHLINEYDINILCVAGQHDQQFHNPDLDGTALGTLMAAGYVTLLTDNPLIIGKTAFYGSSWKGDTPEITTPELFNVLVLHKMIIEDKLWAAQEGHTWANHILIKNKFDLIVSGDNHTQFTATVGKKSLINMGAMMRSTIAQVLHHPACVVYDTDTGESVLHQLKIAPIENVMCIDKAKAEKEKNADLDKFVSSLKGNDDEKDGHAIKLDFVVAMHDYVEKNSVEEDVSSIIFEAME